MWLYKKILFGHSKPLDVLSAVIRKGKKYANEALLKCKNYSYKGSPSRDDNHSSEWNSPKLKDLKTPMFPEWSPYTGTSDESNILSRSESLLTLPKVPSGVKPWKLDKGEKVKLLTLEDTSSIVRSSSQQALKIYTQAPTSPSYPSSPKSVGLKKSPKTKIVKYKRQKDTSNGEMDLSTKRNNDYEVKSE